MQLKTVDKRVEEIVEDMNAKLDLDCWSPECACSGLEKVEAWLRTTLTQYHQDISTALVEALEGKKLREGHPDAIADYNQALTEAQNIINGYLI